MSSIPTIGSAGHRLDLLIRQGATFGPVTDLIRQPIVGAVAQADGSYADDDLEPVDLTGSTIRGQIRKLPADSAAVATFDVNISDPLSGSYTFGLTAAVTAAISAGLDSTKPESTYHWDIEWQDSMGRVTPLHWGVVRVHREVTRP